MGRKTDKPVESVLKDHNDVTLKAFMVNDLHLSGNELIVFAVVYSFSQDGESWFYGSRKYLASWCQVQVGAVDYQLKKLIEKGLVVKKHVRRDDGSLQCMLKANLPLVESMQGQSQKFDRPVSKICDTHSQKFKTGQSQKFMTNTKEEDTQEDTKEDIKAATAEIIAYLNDKTDKRFKASNKQTMEMVNARLSDGYTVEDFKRVIDNKCATWLGDEKMDVFLRPQTLFRPSHFDCYLNERTNAGRGVRDATPYDNLW